jgi:hypothetical protein
MIHHVAAFNIVLSRMSVAGGYIEERFLDCVSRRFAQKQKHGTLRSE